jgi:hypothetical protein
MKRYLLHRQMQRLHSWPRRQQDAPTATEGREREQFQLMDNQARYYDSQKMPKR